MEEYRKDAWVEIVERCEAVGVDGFELNFSCPHGLPERKMGAAMAAVRPPRLGLQRPRMGRTSPLSPRPNPHCRRSRP